MSMIRGIDGPASRWRLPEVPRDGRAITPERPGHENLLVAGGLATCRTR